MMSIVKGSWPDIESSISVEHQYLFRPPILNYGLIAFTLTYLSTEQK